MNKQQFLQTVREMTSDLPQNEANRLFEYYAEMIDEAVEEGATEEEAVAADDVVIDSNFNPFQRGNGCMLADLIKTR